MTSEKNQDPAPAPSEPKQPRRRFTPEQRIANREAEIARIKEARCERVRESIDELVDSLREAEARAAEASMTVEAQRLHAALEALSPE